ncbi:patatin-like phospholipase RssA [Aestuariibacter sp. AA17]|uniref:Patatin-like phospholipase RssA n=1 Tax=Fluctibacter corallii TaxID=2984329 RepID=A0ABT3A6B1_9ALTE|nr:patatin-like phospholipase RssA [Aestuariibacter sp. AA17]MCV2884217.1 patatin-like phospholipase RssA [Aestuariibacter sp. AA17]
MKIGLALGSGAARGWAHIGIIKALESLEIKVDVVAGCSIGAYVGAAYANNKLDELGDWASELTEWQVLSLMGVGLYKGGLASGQKVFDVLREKFTPEHFEELKKPLAVSATDLYSGNEVTFMNGPIMPAVKASCAIPGLFAPHLHEDRWLVDGAVVNPVPVNLCRQMGADFVIAVNLSADFRPSMQKAAFAEHEQNQQKTNDFFSKSQAIFQQWFSGNDKDETPKTDETMDDNTQAETILKKKLGAPSIIGVMSSSLEILQARVTRSRLAGDPPDILIEPQLRDFGIMEFYRAKELIAEGERSVERLKEQIRYQLMLN